MAKMTKMVGGRLLCMGLILLSFLNLSSSRRILLNNEKPKQDSSVAGQGGGACLFGGSPSPMIPRGGMGDFGAGGEGSGYVHGYGSGDRTSSRRILQDDDEPKPPGKLSVGGQGGGSCLFGGSPSMIPGGGMGGFGAGGEGNGYGSGGRISAGGGYSIATPPIEPRKEV